MSAGINPAKQAKLLAQMGVPAEKATRAAGWHAIAVEGANQAVKRRGRMNKLESRYAVDLDVQKRSGIVKDWKFEPVKFCIADGLKRAWYTPDFLVLYDDGTCVFEELKGFWREAARLRIKVVAAQFPMFRFRSRQPRKAKDGGGWLIEMFSDSEAF